MSIATIDPQTYDNILQDRIAYWIDQGLDLKAAVGMAKDDMETCFRKGTDTSRDDELDQKESGIYG